ncbi:MAG: hypothetical protein WCD18_08760 [Thermosynechococcaceae cyanobacterium]
MTTSYTGGQCPEWYSFEGGSNTIVLYDPETGAELDSYTVDFQPDHRASILGPILRVQPDVGDTFGPHSPQGVLSIIYPPYIFITNGTPNAFKNTKLWQYCRCKTANYRFVRVDGQSDDCGNLPEPPQQNPCNPLPGQPACPVPAPANSDFEVHSGAVTETVDLLTYQSLGETRGLTLRYSSLSADPRPILHFRYSQVYNPHQTIIAKLTIRRGSFTYNVPGYPRQEFGLTRRENFWSVPTIGDPAYNNGIDDAALQADLRDQPSGLYDYTWRRSIQYIDPDAPVFAPLDAAETGNFIHVNRVNSPFGAGWSLAGWQELIANSDGSLLLLDGDGTQLLFSAPTGNVYGSPTGDFSRLEKLSDNSYRRTLTDTTWKVTKREKYNDLQENRVHPIAAAKRFAPIQVHGIQLKLAKNQSVIDPPATEQ